MPVIYSPVFPDLTEGRQVYTPLLPYLQGGHWPLVW